MGYIVDWIYIVVFNDCCIYGFGLGVVLIELIIYVLQGIYFDYCIVIL